MHLPDPRRLEAFADSHRSLVLSLLIVLCLASWTASGAALGYVYSVARGLPDRNAVRTAGSMARATTITDANGRHAFTIFEEQRLQVPLSRISPNLTRAIVAVEDQRFYAHSGVDPIRVMGALINDLVKYRAEQGASTITQQLARLSFLTPEKTIRRKLQELVLAGRLERTFTKAQILELYLNKVYFGDGLYGAEAASLGYFGKHASDLNVAEAALLAGLVKSPSTYAPTVNVHRALARRGIVLAVMRDSGAIDGPTYRSALRSPLHDARSRHATECGSGGGTCDSGHRTAAAPAPGKGSDRRTAASRPRRDRSAHGRCPRARRRARLRRESLRPRHAIATAARLRLQAHRLCRGARARIHTRNNHRRPQFSGCVSSGVASR